MHSLVGYTDKKYSFKESSVARHERLGSMVLQEMDSHEIQAGVQGLEIYDDVPADDDTTVFKARFFKNSLMRIILIFCQNIVVINR